MKNDYLKIGCIYLFSILFFSGCSPIGEKTTSMSIIYLTTTIFSLLLVLGYIHSVKKKETWFVILFVSVFVVNVGYFSLSVSDTLNGALWANRISYLGSVFLPLSMVMTILNISKLEYKKYLPMVLLIISIVVFLIAASPGILDIYYKSVTLSQINGVTVLIKEYGDWHSIYLFYLLSYFMIMITTTLHAIIKKKIEKTAHAVIIIVAVFVNICVWLLEQLVKIDFEFLSVSYIITELFLLSIYLTIEHQENTIALLKEKIIIQPLQKIEPSKKDSKDFTAHCNYIVENLHNLTSTEKAIYNCYIKGMSTKEVLKEMSITENTLKFHNKNIYGKLGVSSRKELLEYTKLINLNNITKTSN